jgi:hypothetical protein
VHNISLTRTKLVEGARVEPAERRLSPPSVWPFVVGRVGLCLELRLSFDRRLDRG